jgi:hypothetical protein
MRKLIAVLLASATAAACSGSSTSASNAIPLEEVPSELAKSYCAAEQACDPFFYSIAFANTDCVARFTATFQQASFTDIQNAVSAGTVKYDGAKARSCADAISAGACTTLDNNAPNVCQEALAGTVDTGGDCTIDQECKGLARCDTSSGTCPGKCAALASAGVACGSDDDCVKGTVCSPATSHCAAPAADGEPCKGTTAGNCGAGLICVGNDDAKKTPGKCMTASAVLVAKDGESCDLTAGPWCVAGSSCVVQSIAQGVPVSQCQPMAAPGGTCGIGIPGQCPAGQYCPLQLADLAAKMFTASCTDLPKAGEACAPAIALNRCAANLVCDDLTTPLKPVCTEPHALGQTCSGDSLCVSQHCVGGACVPASPCAK